MSVDNEYYMGGDRYKSEPFGHTTLPAKEQEDLRLLTRRYSIIANTMSCIRTLEILYAKFNVEATSTLRLKLHVAAVKRSDFKEEIKKFLYNAS